MRTRSLAIAAVFAALGVWLAGGAATAGAATPTAKAHASVIGGGNASIQDLPWLAYLEGETATGAYACSGTVVAPRVILTAGHCVMDVASGEITPAETLAVATGVANLKQIQPANVSRVSQALVYPHFNAAELHGDAGLLILTSPTTSPPIALAGGEDSGLFSAGRKLTIAGWGLKSGNAKEAPAQLQKGTTKLQSAKSCRRRTRHFYPVFAPTLQLCTLSLPSLTTGVCSGDSGGPAIAFDSEGAAVEVGVASLVGAGCSPKLPNVYTRSDLISGWVGRWIAAVEEGGPRPAIRVPKAHKPFLSRSRAKELVRAGLGHDFGRRYTRSVEKRFGCKRRAKAKIKCKVSWYQGGNDYWGTVTVYYAIVGNSVGWFYRYTINWVNNHCYFYSGHRSSCKIHTKRR